MHLIRNPRQLLISLLHDTQRQHAQIHRHDAAAHALSLSLSRTPGSVTAVSVAQQQPHASRVHDSLLHRETLLVVAAGNFEDVAFEFGADAVAGDFVAHAAVHEDAEFALIFDLDELLCTIGRVGDVELHLDGGVMVKMGGFVVVVCQKMCVVGLDAFSVGEIDVWALVGSTSRDSEPYILTYPLLHHLHILHTLFPRYTFRSTFVMFRVLRFYFGHRVLLLSMSNIIRGRA